MASSTAREVEERLRSKAPLGARWLWRMLPVSLLWHEREDRTANPLISEHLDEIMAPSDRIAAIHEER